MGEGPEAVLAEIQNLTYQQDFTSFAHSSLSAALTWFLQLELSAEELERVLLYHELMQQRNHD